MLLLPLVLLLSCGDKDAGGVDSAPGGDDGDGATPSTDDDTADGGSDGGSDDSSTATDGADSGAAAGCETRRWHPDGAVRIDTQAGLAPFCEQYNAVDGDLFVDVGGVEDPITELDGIKCLCEVTGDLTITGDASAPVPDGPPHVTGDIELSVLERVGGDLVLSSHPNLSYVEGLRGLTEVGGDIVISGSPDLQVASFYALQRLGGALRVHDMDKQLILRLPNATTIGGLELGAPGDAGTLFFLVELKLDDLQEIEGDVEIHGTRNLALLAAPALTRIGGALALEGACQAKLSLPLLEEVGSLVLTGHCALADLAGLPALARVTGQDDQGRSLQLSANSGLSADELAAFVAGLSITGGGTVVAEAGSCETVMADFGAGYCP